MRARPPRSCTVASLAALAAVPSAALAHGPEEAPTLATAWSLSPWFLVPALALLALYLLGLGRLWRRAGPGRGVSPVEATAFAAGVLALFLAAVWPLDAYGEWSLAAHMGQHMLLLAFAPPLLLAGRPMAGIAHALPRAWSGPLHRAVAGVHARAVAGLAPATAAQAAVMGLWHLPAATAAALADDGVHWLMHGSFLLAGLWFWAALWHRVREPSAGVGPALVAIVVVMMQMGFVGALLTFSRRALYPVYAERAPVLGLEVLADQQLAGLIMWVPAALPYLIGGLWLMRQGLQRAERRQAGADVQAAKALDADQRGNSGQDIGKSGK
ncbi:MAG: cytochrome c oxidase assembly protein [Proteobacteria bacterium]|nr:cytochrome c oxidase assembly protein [Pseudomonadota bacterium]